jgi:hypothetical protein
MAHPIHRQTQLGGRVLINAGWYNGWGVTQDAADPDRLVEWLVVASRAERLRQRRRVSHADADLQAEIARRHAGEGWPVARPLLGLDPPHAA